MNAKEYFKKWFKSISRLSCKLLDFNETYITISQAIDFAEAYHKSEAEAYHKSEVEAIIKRVNGNDFFTEDVKITLTKMIKQNNY